MEKNDMAIPTTIMAKSQQYRLWYSRIMRIIENKSREIIT
jgi:hypothetical protein